MIKNYIISAFSIYPGDTSSEGIVNKNWIAVLMGNNRSTIILNSSNQKFVNLLYRLSKNKQINIFSLFYKVLNKLFVTVFKTTMHNFYWVKNQQKELLNEVNKGIVVWARVLPLLSLKPVLEAYEKNNFPYIVNINDPLIIGKKSIEIVTEDERMLLLTKNTAQAWTFPSSKLLNYFSKLYGLDEDRCFVIPHAMKDNEVLYDRKSELKKVKILYTGTFYKSAFTNELQDGLINFCKSELFDSVEFTFVLSQYDKKSIDWLKETIPGVNLKFKLKREEVISLIKVNDCMLVVDAENHQDLLKGKLAEAISFGIPIFAATFKDSIMDKVVMEYGGISAYHNVKSDIFCKLIDLVKNIQNENYFKDFYLKRKEVLTKLSEEKILEATEEISEFAYNRFWQIDKVSSTALKAKYNWP